MLGGTPRLVMQGGIDFPSSYSPDGTQFAFLRANSGRGKVDVLIANADGSNERVLTTRPYFDEFIGVAWSPDGKTIAFATSESTKSVRSVLSAVSVVDGSVREIYSTPNAIGRPRWLPDGSGLSSADAATLIRPFAGNSGSFLFQRRRAQASYERSDGLPTLLPGSHSGRQDSCRHRADNGIRSVDRARRRLPPRPSRSLRRNCCRTILLDADGRHRLCQRRWQSVRS